MKLFNLFLATLLFTVPMGCSVATAAAGDTRIRADYVDGQSSTRNYIKDGDAETGLAVKGWSCYADAAGTRPVDGTGGTPNVTFTKTNSSPLEHLNSFVFTKDAVNRQGQGCSYDFTIDAKDKASVLTIDLSQVVGSGTFAAGSSTTDSDVIVYLYDVTNSKLIEPSTFKFYSNSTTLAEGYKSYFQTAPDSTSYRLILHVASTSASAYTLKLDSIKVSRSNIVYGTIITDWQSYTPIVSGLGAGSTSQLTAWQRRVGSNLEVKIFARKDTTAGTGSSTITFSIPSGILIDTTVSPNSSILDGSGALGAGSNALLMPYQVTSTTVGVEQNDASVFIGSEFTANLAISFNFSAPIQGWSSGATLPDGYDGRVVTTTASLGSNQTISSSSLTKIQLNTVGTGQDTTASLDLTNNRIVIKKTGIYDVSISTQFDPSTMTTGETYLLTARLNNTSNLFSTLVSTPSYVGTSTRTGIPLIAGDYIELHTDSEADTSYVVVGNQNTRLSVTERSGSFSYAPLAAVAEHWAGTAGDAIGTSDSLIKFTTKVDSTHGAYNPSTGVFTAPENGRYEIDWAMVTGLVNLSTSQRFNSTAFLDGVSFKSGHRSLGVGVSVNHSSSGSFSTYLKQGQTIDIRGISDVATTAGLSTNVCYLSIIKVAN